MNREFANLTAARQAVVRCAIESVRSNPDRFSQDLADGSEVYAYPGRDCVHWGVNGPEGCNIARGKLMNGSEL